MNKFLPALSLPDVDRHQPLSLSPEPILLQTRPPETVTLSLLPLRDCIHKEKWSLGLGEKKYTPFDVEKE